MEVKEEVNCTGQDTLRAPGLAYWEGNESSSLSVESILQTLKGNKDKLVQRSLLFCASHPASTFILSVNLPGTLSLSHLFGLSSLFIHYQ